MHAMLTLKLSIGASDDLREEREVAWQLVDRLQARYWSFLTLETGEEYAPDGEVVILLNGSELRLRRVKASAKRNNKALHESLEFSNPREFSRLIEARLESLLLEEIQKQTGTRVRPPDPDLPPYKGPASYSLQDSPIFFGRREATLEALAQLRHNHQAGRSFLLVHGPPKSGKSSLLHAGIAQALTSPLLPAAEIGAWRIAAFAPGAAPLEALANALLEAVPELAKLRDAWDAPRLANSLGREGEGSLAVSVILAALDRLSAANPAHLLVAIDPLDALFAATGVSDETREQFCRAIADFSRSRRIWVIAATQADHFASVAGHPVLAQLACHGGAFMVSRPSGEEIRQIIEYPALAAGLAFEVDPELALPLSDEIHRLALDLDRPLPALSGTLENLHHHRQDKLLTWDSFYQFGGLGVREKIPSAVPKAPRKYLRRYQVAAAAVAIVAGVAAIRSVADRDPANPDAATEIQRDPALAAARVELALLHLQNGQPAAALPVLIEALRQDPSSQDAQALLISTLRQTDWHVPLASVKQASPIAAIAFGSGDGLYIGSEAGAAADGINTVVRWNLTESPQLGGALTPGKQPSLHSLSVAPGGATLIVRRGGELPEQLLLCDGESMAVIASLPIWQGGALPPACFVWSSDGLLLGYPSAADESPDGPLVWRIVDARSGGTIRESEPLGDPKTWLAAHLDRENLQVVATDGTLLELPVSPAETQQLERKLPSIFSAEFAPDGGRLRIALANGREPAPLATFSPSADQADDWSQIEESPEQWPVDPYEAWQSGGFLYFQNEWRAPLALTGDVRQVAVSGKRVAIASAAGEVRVFESLPSLQSSFEVFQIDPPTDPAVLTASDPSRGWSATLDGRSLRVSLANGTGLLSIELPAVPHAMEFAESAGMSGLRMSGALAGFIPLAKPGGLTGGEIDTLEMLVEALAGTPGGTTLAARQAAAAGMHRGLLGGLLPGGEVDILLDHLAASVFRTADPAGLQPLWEQLAASGGWDDLTIAGWAADLGKDHPWFQSLVLSLIAKQDRELYAGRLGDEAAALLRLHDLAGDDSRRGALKQAAWQIRKAPTPETAGLLEQHVLATAPSPGKVPTLAAAIAHAEALALSGDMEAASAVLTAHWTDDIPSLEETAFLISTRLSSHFDEKIGAAIESHGSSWLARHWLESLAENQQDLAGPVEQVMKLSGGSGPAAVAALRLSLESGDVDAIGNALKHGKNIPQPLRTYAIARIRWEHGQKTEVFETWPDGFPDLRKLADSGEWGDWSAAVPWQQVDEFFTAVDGGLAPLQASPEADLDELRKLADHLLQDETVAEFGGRKVRDAMVETALALARDPESSERVMRMVDIALLSGADPLQCLRAEARAFMSQGEFTAAFARWLQLLETQPDALIAEDFLEAAHCVFEDEQDEPALILLARGSERFPADSSFALNSAWLALATGYPENAASLLERGFDAGFADVEKETAIALRVCVAEKNGHHELADAFFTELTSISKAWLDPETVTTLEWPPLIQEPFLAVLARFLDEPGQSAPEADEEP